MGVLVSALAMVLAPHSAGGAAAASQLGALRARNFSAAKLRSQNWLLKNMPMMAATGKALRMQACCNGEKPRLGR